MHQEMDGTKIYLLHMVFHHITRQVTIVILFLWWGIWLVLLLDQKNWIVTQLYSVAHIECRPIYEW